MRTLSFPLVAVLALAVAVAAATTPKSSAKNTTASHKSAASASKTAAKSHTLTGCLSGPNSDGAYLLTNRYWQKGVEVGGMDTLKSHIGHEVRLSGMWVGTPEQIGLKEVAQKNAAGAHKMAEHFFKVENLTHVADTCNLTPKVTSKPAAKNTTKKS